MATKQGTSPKVRNATSKQRRIVCPGDKYVDRSGCGRKKETTKGDLLDFLEHKSRAAVPATASAPPEPQPYDYAADVYNRTISALTRREGTAFTERDTVICYIRELCYGEGIDTDSLSTHLKQSKKKLIMSYFKTSCIKGLHVGVTLPGMKMPEYKTSQHYVC